MFLQLFFGGKIGTALCTSISASCRSSKWCWGNGTGYRQTVFRGSCQIRMGKFHVFFQSLETLATFLALGTFYKVVRAGAKLFFFDGPVAQGRS